VGTDLKYSGGGDDDHVSLDGVGIGEDFTATLAGGNNDVTLNDCIGTNVKITAGSGDDTVAFTAPPPSAASRRSSWAAETTPSREAGGAAHRATRPTCGATPMACFVRA
jgi:hypothetical protein